MNHLVLLSAKDLLILFLNYIIFTGSKAFGCNRVIPEGLTEDPGGYGRLSDVKRDNVLNCTCGIPPLPGKPDSSTFHFSWHVLVAHVHRKSAGDAVLPSGKLCQGTLINDLVILTTASCVLKISVAQVMDDISQSLLFPGNCMAKPEELRVFLTYQMKLRPKDNTSNSVGLEIIGIDYHPLFLFHRSVKNKVDYDIALITLKTRIQFDTYTASALTPVCLPNRFPPNNQDLTGVPAVSTRWLVADVRRLFDTEASDSVEEEPPARHFYENRMRCRVNTEATWISDRFLCTLAPEFSPKRYVRIYSGGALLVESNGQFAQFGMHSWASYFPLLNGKKPVRLATNVTGFARMIDIHSKKVGAKWCRREWQDGRLDKATNFMEDSVNEPGPQQVEPWLGITSEFRPVRKTCPWYMGYKCQQECGRVNSLALGRIQGGEEANPYDYGWQVQLQGKYGREKQLCGGALVNDRIVVTAAHCVFEHGKDTPSAKITPENMEVHLHRHKGPHGKDEHSRIAKVKAIITHPGFSTKNGVPNDIALLVLSKPLDFAKLKGKVSPICLQETNETLQIDGRADAKIIGWGRVDAKAKGIVASVLQELTVKVITNEECHDILSDISPHVSLLLNQKKLCAGTFHSTLDYQDPAQGDSGGPLFIPMQPASNTMMHIGIASMVTFPIQVDNPSLAHLKTVVFYTRTSAFIDFVDYYSLIADASWCSR